MFKHDAPEQLYCGANLALDTMAARVCLRLYSEKIETILLRGPALTEWLYGNTSGRTSTDVDLLVHPDCIPRAEAVIAQLGYRLSVETTPGTMPNHATNWRRPDAVTIDLHWTIGGARAKPAHVWDVMRAHTQLRQICDTAVLVPAPEARPFLIALHAGQHGRHSDRTLRDLDRTLVLVGLKDWRIARDLAYELDAVELFSSGLRMSRTGSQVARALRLPTEMSTETALLSSKPLPTSTGFAWLARVDGLPARLRLLLYKVVPPIAFVRDWHPIARRGRIGLGLAYLYRLLWLTWWAPRGYFAWRQAMRAAAASRRSDRR